MTRRQWRAGRAIHTAVPAVPATAWTPAVEPDGEIRGGAWGAELDGDCLTGRPAGQPKGMRLIVRKERPHPGAQLRFTDADGLRLTAFATNTADTPIAELKPQHRRRARVEDRIRAARATGLTNLPLHDTAQNEIWLEIIQLVLEPLASMQMLAPTGEACLWEPRRLRLRLLSAAAFTFAVLCAADAVTRSYPFGPRTRSVNDLGNQYQGGCPARGPAARLGGP